MAIIEDASNEKGPIESTCYGPLLSRCLIQSQVMKHQSIIQTVASTNSLRDVQLPSKRSCKCGLMQGNGTSESIRRRMYFTTETMHMESLPVLPSLRSHCARTGGPRSSTRRKASRHVLSPPLVSKQNASRTPKTLPSNGVTE